MLSRLALVDPFVNGIVNLHTVDLPSTGEIPKEALHW